DVFDEMRNFAPAKSQLLFPFCGKQMALTICEDAWNDKHFWNKRLYTFDPVEALIQAGGNFVLNISASPFWLGKREFRRNMLATIAKNYKVPIVMGTQSGGIDSALTACIAVDALGPENVLGIGMPGPYSSQGSIDDARALAKNLGIRFELLCITEIFEAYRKVLQKVFSGRKEDETEENIQSRARGMMLMALSNKFGAIVLSTGNKSELAVGYCTLYGDMAGGLAAISVVPKTLVYRLSHYV